MKIKYSRILISSILLFNYSLSHVIPEKNGNDTVNHLNQKKIIISINKKPSKEISSIYREILNKIKNLIKLGSHIKENINIEKVINNYQNHIINEENKSTLDLSTSQNYSFSFNDVETSPSKTEEESNIPMTTTLLNEASSTYDKNIYDPTESITDDIYENTKFEYFTENENNDEDISNTFDDYRYTMNIRDKITG